MPKYAPAKQSLPERNAQRARIWAARKAGKSYAKIGKDEGLSKPTVQSMCGQMDRAGFAAMRTGGRKSTITKTYVALVRQVHELKYHMCYTGIRGNW
jgi:transposase